MSTKQHVRPSLHDVRRFRRESAAVVQRMFPDLSQVSGRLKSAISRARNGHDGPVLRLDDYLLELRRIGGGREQAEILRAHLDARIDELWPAGEIDIRVAMLREQEAEGRANVLQLRAMTEPAAAAAWVEAEQDEMAAARAAIAAVRAQASGRKAAA